MKRVVIVVFAVLAALSVTGCDVLGVGNNNTVSGTVTFTNPAATGDELVVELVSLDTLSVAGSDTVPLSSGDTSATYSISGLAAGSYIVEADLNNSAGSTKERSDSITFAVAGDTTQDLATNP